MNLKSTLLTTFALGLLLTSGSVRGESEFFKEFKNHYDGDLLTDLSRKPEAELGTVKDFVYRKDIAEFHFDDGKIYVLRDVLGRPTTAIFIGKGRAIINVPVHTERQSLYWCSKDSTVNEPFETCFIRMADDFDLRLREKCTFEKTSLPWGDFNKVSQGEFFFDPKVMHDRDNLFELLRSVYERKEDGFFWIDFNRYVYSFDPNRPEEVVVGYEKEGGDIEITPGAVLQRQEKGILEDSQISDITFPTTILSRSAILEMGGADGTHIRNAQADLSLRLNADSTRFVSLFLHYDLKLDSMSLNGKPIDFYRRRDFTFIGVILPGVAHTGDTLNLRLWYHGKNYGSPLPFIADPEATPDDLTFIVPKGYTYLMPGKGPVSETDDGRLTFHVPAGQPYASFVFQPMSTGIDTIPLITDMGMTLNVIKSDYINKRNFQCCIPDETYQQTVLGAFNYGTSLLGSPPGVFELFAYPDSSLSMPGLMEISQTICVRDGTGGLEMLAGKAVGRQWFGASARLKTDRELWLLAGVPDYLGLMYVGRALDMATFFGELSRRGDLLYTLVDNHRDVPLAAGRRVEGSLRTAKGAWVIHMLRFLMYDLEKHSDTKFNQFLATLANMVNSKSFNNNDVIALAEKYYGGPLDWFFRHWLYSGGFPEYKVQYKIEKRGAEYFITARADVEQVEPDFRMPVIMRVQDKNGKSTYFRQLIQGKSTEFELGPFVSEPDQFIFNELYSVLARSDVKKK